MEKCPTEIHAYIFELACTDGGAAGTALSAVSHYVRAISAPYQWYTLAVAGTTQTVRLAERIRMLTPTQPAASADSEKGKGKTVGRGGPEITHLFVSNRPASRARELRYQEMGATRDMAERRRIEAVFNAEADAWARAVRVLFAYAAPTLCTLAMMCYDIHVSPNGRLFFSDLKRYRFPLLAELSIRGGFDTRLREYDSAQHGDTRARMWEAADGEGDGGGRRRGETDEPTLPALRRLHLSSPISFDLFLQRLRPLAPGLTHVRLSELLAYDYDMVRALHSELAERGIVPARLPRLRERQWSAEPRAVPVDWDRFLPPPGTLHRLVVQPAQLPPAPEELCGCCSGYYRVDDMTRLLREMAREAILMPEEDAPVYVFLPPGPRHNAYGFREGYRDWLGRAVGERGCWKEQDEVDIDAKAVAAGGDAKAQSWDVVGRRSRSRWF